MRIAAIGVALGISMCVSALSPAEAKTRRTERAPMLVAVTQCRTIAEPAARLRCFDTSVAALDSAERSQAVVVIDDQQVRETRRNLFGINLPNIDLFGKSDDLPQIETTLSSATADGTGSWTFILADGARWVQTDDNIIARRPRANDKVIIKRAALGSFRLSVGGQPGVKAKRQN